MSKIQFISGSLARLSGLLLLTFAATMLGGCSYYHRAVVEGFVEDSNSEAGINSATVRFYMSEPETADEDGFFARTSTATSGGSAGYFRNTVIWDNYFSSFGAEGDTGTIYLGVTHPDYLGRVVKVPGVLSDDINRIEAIGLQRVTFAAGEVFGRLIQDSDGEPVNGVRVVLTVPELDADGEPTEEKREYVALTGNRAGEAGWFSFSEPVWRDESTPPGGDSEVLASLEVDDNDYRQLEETPVSIGLVSKEDSELRDPVRIVRKPRTEFATVLTGRLYHRPGSNPDADYVGLNGAEIQVTWTADGGPDDDPDDERSVTTETGPDGTFRVQISWKRPEGYEPPEGVPEGEDALDISEGDSIEVRYIHSKIPAADEIRDRSRIRSWINPNRMEDYYVD